jgi:hypothetical protein
VADTLEQFLAALTDTYNDVAQTIAAMPPNQAAFEAATQLTALLQDLANQAALLRADQLQRIWDAEETTLAVLADRVGISAPRAHQILKKGRPQ